MAEDTSEPVAAPFYLHLMPEDHDILLRTLRLSTLRALMDIHLASGPFEDPPPEQMVAIAEARGASVPAVLVYFGYLPRYQGEGYIHYSEPGLGILAHRDPETVAAHRYWLLHAGHRRVITMRATTKRV